ncbi:hypothetical protein GCM10023322_79150 [Rugosimonospora acidiphila]|uniref:Uncharacterized protein n=1 Tax=Rugosimonospora acidiphila TaxID=556531 RepID=A0ABP9ST54_9ACTN
MPLARATGGLNGAATGLRHTHQAFVTGLTAHHPNRHDKRTHHGRGRRRQPISVKPQDAAASPGTTQSRHYPAPRAVPASGLLHIRTGEGPTTPWQPATSSLTTWTAAPPASNPPGSRSKASTT